MGTEVFVRALGKVVRVERRDEEGGERMGRLPAVIERYDIIFAGKRREPEENLPGRCNSITA